MRQFFVALLLPAALVACGGSGGSTETAAAETEAPAAQPAKPAAKKAAAAPIQSAAATGSWAEESINGRQGVSYIAEDGSTVISFTCVKSSEEGMPNSMFVRTNAPAGPDAEQIDIFGGGGSGSVPVTGGVIDAGLISGEFDPSSSLGQSLATGLGDLRIRTGTTETIIPNSEQVEAVVEDCWPSLEERIAAINAEKAAAAEKAALELEERQQDAIADAEAQTEGT